MGTHPETEALVLKYFNSWQEPADYDAFRECLADRIVFDPGGEKVTGADSLTAFIRDSESPWEQVTLLATIVTDAAAALFYDGVDKRTRMRFRVGEHLTIRDGLISEAIVAICRLGTAD